MLGSSVARGHGRCCAGRWLIIAPKLVVGGGPMGPLRPVALAKAATRLRVRRATASSSSRRSWLLTRSSKAVSRSLTRCSMAVRRSFQRRWRRCPSLWRSSRVASVASRPSESRAMGLLAASPPKACCRRGNSTPGPGAPARRWPSCPPGGGRQGRTPSLPPAGLTAGRLPAGPVKRGQARPVCPGADGRRAPGTPRRPASARQRAARAPGRPPLTGHIRAMLAPESLICHSSLRRPRGPLLQRTGQLA